MRCSMGVDDKCRQASRGPAHIYQEVVFASGRFYALYVKIRTRRREIKAKTKANEPQGVKEPAKANIYTALETQTRN